MNFLFSMIPTLVVLGILIVIHEYGHFLACRLFKIKVEKFSIGFGPEILRWKGKETEYVLSLFPIGGYVKPAGETVSELDSDKGPQPGDYLAAPLPARIAVVCAGVAMNYVLAVALFFLLFVAGRPVAGTVIGGFMPGYPAETSGLMKNDKVVSVDGVPVKTFEEMTRQLNASQSDSLIHLTFQRSEEALELDVPFKEEKIQDPFGKEFSIKRLGIKPSPEAAFYIHYAPGPALKEAVGAVLHLAGLTYKSIFYLCIGKMSLKAMTGPVGIVAVTGDAARLGWRYVVQLTANLSVSLAVINLLPIPALDGGHLFFLLIEAIRRKKVSLKFQDRAAQTGFALLMVLMVFVVYNDLANLQVFSWFAGLFGK